MPKIGMAPMRQEQIIRAAIDTIHVDGLSQTSFREIGRRANVSPSLITHYFGNRDALYVEVLAYLNRRTASAILVSLKAARTPRERLIGIALANFDPEHFEPATASAWFALWGMLPEISELGRFQSIYERRLRSNVTYAMRQLIPSPDLNLAVELFIATLDGLWVKAAQPTSPLDSKRAMEAMVRFIDILLRQFSSID